VGIEFESVVDHPLDDVFAWHTRPGAMRRLVPPWQPMTVVAETTSLADGRAILGLPGGLRWVARHDPGGYDPPRRFVDVLSSDGPRSLPPRLVARWRHTHDFDDASDGASVRTRVRDRVEAPVPAAALRSTFVYRHRQLADDLAAHRDAAESGSGPFVVAVTGTSGLVGSALTALLSTGGHRVIRLVRRASDEVGQRRWDPQRPAPDLLDGVDAVVHLAGGGTRRLAELAGRTDGARVFVGASSLADAVADGEAATAPAAEAGLRVVLVRSGVVLAARGGTLRRLRPLFAAGLGGRLGDGRQWLSWIGLDDLLDVYYRAIYDERIAGPVNAVAPNPVRNVDYTKALARVLHRPAVLPRILLGEWGARELALADQRVMPVKLQAVGHRFRQPVIEGALAHQLGHG
jgi:NAD dependent epimerase/dehydratase family enzyme/ligand-binding SRPBCC domain-containing protein